MQRVDTISDIRRAVVTARQAGQRIGCVPTMGALHAGHLSLIEEARRRSDFVVVTIFVNPTQFAPNEDLTRYPRPLEDDLRQCRTAGASLVFTPEVAALYPDEHQTFVDVDQLSRIWEGAARPGHFRGVATIVLKLFNIVQPDVACFGAKDFQQQTLIRRMVTDLDLTTEIVVCPTVREADGLAMSSRNVYLSPADRQSALALYRSLQIARTAIIGGHTDLADIRRQMLACLCAEQGVQPDYATIVDSDTLQELSSPGPRMVALVAARVGKTRLIDNLPIILEESTSSPVVDDA